MERRFVVTGQFHLGVEAKDNTDAKEKVMRILRMEGIEHFILEVEEEKERIPNGK